MKRKLLIVEDEKILCGLIAEQLEGGHVEIQEAYSAEEGLGLVEKEKFDVVLTDIQLPGIDGVSFMKKVKSDSNNGPVFYIMSGYSHYEAEELKKHGATNFYCKPGDIPQMVIDITQALAS